MNKFYLNFKHNMDKAKPKDFGDEGENINISDEELVS
jgi:hypothetical protein